MTKHVVDLLEAVEADNQQRCLAAFGFGTQIMAPIQREACCG